MPGYINRVWRINVTYSYELNQIASPRNWTNDRHSTLGLKRANEGIYLPTNQPTYLDTILSRLILGVPPANERRRYKLTPSLIGWALIPGSVWSVHPSSLYDPMASTCVMWGSPRGVYIHPACVIPWRPPV